MRHTTYQRWLRLAFALTATLAVCGAPGVPTPAAGASEGAPVVFPVASGPNHLTAGPDGNVWFTNANADSVGRITPQGTVTSFADPGGMLGEMRSITAASGPSEHLVWVASTDTTVAGRGDQITSIVATPGGPLPVGSMTRYTTPTSGIGNLVVFGSNIWFTSEQGIGRMQITDGIVDVFPVPGEATSLALGQDANLWFTNGNVGRMSPSTGQVTTFARPTNLDRVTSIINGPDGQLWVGAERRPTAPVAGRPPEGSPFIGVLAKVTLNGAYHTFHEFSLAWATPRVRTCGADGNAWYSGMVGGTKRPRLGLSRITPSGATADFDTGLAAWQQTVVTDAAVGPDGNTWFAETESGGPGAIGYIPVTPAAGACSLPVSPQSTLRVSVDGSGTGTVSGGGIDCPDHCTESFPLGLQQTVTLTATPAAGTPAGGSTFAGWSGDCSGRGPCEVTMNTNRDVTATFALDTTKPTVDLRTPPAAAVYTRNQAVAADFSCADEAGGSGIATCVGTVADGAPVNTTTLGSRSFTVTATDLAGNTKTVTRTYTVRDTTRPTVDLRTPPAGVVYARNQAVAADFSCADEAGGSGIATCVGTVADGARVNTTTLGGRSFTVTATDRDGNTKAVTHNYTVALPRPDGRIRLGATGTLSGNNVYNTDGTGQTSSGSAARGNSVTYTVSAQNDAPFREALHLRGTASSGNFTVQYTVDGVDVTAEMIAGTYTTPTLAPGATHTVSARVTVTTAAPAGSSLTANVTIKSSADPTSKDKVKFVTRRA